MKTWHYKNKVLHIEDCPVNELTRHCKTPFYVYSARAAQASYQHFEKFAGAGSTICFAVKANSNQALLTLLAKLGAGADIVSEGEGRRVLAAGIAPEKIYFSGVGKTEQDLRFALEAGIGQINVESSEELERLAMLSSQLNKRPTLAFRVNPDIKAGAHDKISTGKRGDKFGLSFDEVWQLYAKAQSSPLFDVKGLAVHIGSQIFELDVFEQAWHKLGAFAEKLRGQGLLVETLDLGGGLGIGEDRDLLADIRAYSEAALGIAKLYQCSIVLSPGRAIIGMAGGLVVSVIEEKEALPQTFLIVDGAMNDFLRPSLYGAHHPVLPVAESAAATKVYQLAGPICESGDVLARDVTLPRQGAGDLLVLAEAGAYGAVLASNYNSRLRVPEMMVEGTKCALVRARSTYQAMIEKDEVPEWMKN